MNFLTVAGISKKSGSGFLLQNVEIGLQKFKKLAIAGETGSGKSTLLKIIAGLIQPDAGEVIFGGERILGPEEKLIPGHPKIAYLSQHFELRNHYFVEELLEMANKLTAEEVKTINEICRITHLLKRRTHQLSGGEKQRIATALLLVTAPRLLLLDEPYSNLDIAHKKILKAVINDISDRLGITCILVSHDPVDTLSWADEILVMKDGEIIQKGTPTQVYRQPKNEYVAALFGSYNLLSYQQSLHFLPEAKGETKSTQLFTRPENFTITNNEKNAVMAEVTTVNFLGSYDEIELITEEVKIFVLSEPGRIKKGELVFVFLNNNESWYI